MQLSRFAPATWLRLCLAVCLSSCLVGSLGAVPPTKEEPSKSTASASADKDKPHPADGRVAEKVAEASAEGQQAMGSFKKPEGWQVALFAAEPELANPVALFVDRLSRVFVCESFRQGVGVTDNRSHNQEWLRADLAAQSVEDRIAYHRKLLGDKADEYTQHDDRIRLLMDTNGDGIADQATMFADQFNRLEDGTGAGVLEVNGDVFFTCIPKLWRLRDKDNDGVAEERTALYDGFGVRVAFRGHDMHGLVVGPDGRLYFSIGDRGYNVKTSNNHFVDPESGAVFRCELDGSNLEIFATGLRNPQELAFDDWGNLFTGDNNSDSGDKARWVNVLEGGDTGWRMMYQYISDRGPFNREKIWQPYSSDTPAYIVPPVDNIADGPSGLTYYPGTGLTKEFANCFLLVDFRGGPSNSGIRLVKVKPKGAFWEIDRNEQLIWSILATDADFGPDGALWVCDWVDGWVGEGKGRIYRFFNPTAQSEPIVKEVQSLLKSGFADLDNNALSKLLSHADRRVRSGAQYQLAARGRSEEFAQLARESQATSIPRLHAIWGLAQVARAKATERESIVQVLSSLTADADSDVRKAAVAALGDAGLAPGDATAVSAAVIKLLADNDPRVRYAAAISAGKLQIAGAFEAVLKLLVDNGDNDPALRHAGIMALRGTPDSTRLVALTQHPVKSVRLAAVVALRKRLDPQVAAFLKDSDIAVQTEAARAVNDVPQLHSALPALAALTNSTDVPDALLHRVLNANFRLGAVNNAKAIAAIAADAKCSEAMRREALEMLRTWAEPGELDRVMNRFQPLTPRDGTPARDALAAVLDSSGLAGGMRSLALSVAADLGIEQALAPLEKIARTTSSETQVRIDAVKSLMKLNAKAAAPVMKDLAADQSGPVRAAAMTGLTKLDPAAATPMLVEATKSQDMIERQSAWDTLASIDTPAATQAIAEGLQQYLAGKLPADVWMNVIEASEGRVDAAAMAAREAFEKAEGEKDPLAAYRDCLAGGDVKAGEKIFMTRTELSCVRCHKVGNKGGEVGPKLTDIAKTKDSRYLLEAIVHPDAKIAENFETIVVLTDEDEVLTGILKKETSEKITLMTADGKSVDVQVESIVQRKKGKSSMPADLIKLMTRRQLRDLVAYLGSLKGE